MNSNIKIIDAQEDTPRINLEKGNLKNIIKIEGISMPENAFEFYDHLINELTLFFTALEKIELHVKLDYMNSMTNKQLLKFIANCFEKDNSLIVYWKYEKMDELMKIKGEEIVGIYPEINILLQEY